MFSQAGHGFRIPNRGVTTETVDRSSAKSEVVNSSISQDRRELDEDAADESLMEFCKPIEFYSIMKHRFTHLPFFLPRSLSYKIDAARLKRMRMKVSVTACMDANGVLPKVVHRCAAGQFDAVSVYVMQTIPLLSSSMLDYWFELGEPRVLKAPLVKSWSLDGYGFRNSATFRLPDIRKVVSRAKKDGAVVLFLIILESDAPRVGKDGHLQSLVNCSGRVLWAKLPMSTLCSTWVTDSNSSSVSTKEKPSGSTYQVDLQNATLQHGDSGGRRGIKLSIPLGVSARVGVQLQLCISGLQVGQTVTESDPLGCSGADLENPTRRLRMRPDFRVVFHFHYGKSHIVQQIQDSDPFSCPICLVSCCSFKGLRYHLNCCHDLFNFEYLTCESSYLVVVSIREGVLGDQGVNWRVVGQDQDSKAKMFSYVSRRQNRLKNRPVVSRRTVEHAQEHSETLQSKAKFEVEKLINDRMRHLSVDEASATVAQGEENILDPATDRFSDMYVQPPASERPDCGSQLRDASPSVASSVEPRLLQPLQLVEVADPQRVESVEHGVIEPRGGSVPGDDQDLPRSPFNQVTEKSRKVSVEKMEARNRAALGKHQFYHAHTAQPMALEEVLSAEDSEAEVDEEIAAIEDRRLLDEFVDVQPDEKELMHMWNCFVSKQRVIADGHCPWACEAFAKFHVNEFVKKPSLRWCMLMLLIKLWNHQLVDGGTIHACLKIIDNAIEAAAI